MNYTNYKTDKPCSREEYIQNGLERGELLYNYNCGCVLIQDRTADAYIVCCPKHGAAPELYEACKEALKFFVAYDAENKVVSGLSLYLNEAIAKAE